MYWILFVLLAHFRCLLLILSLAYLGLACEFNEIIVMAVIAEWKMLLLCASLFKSCFKYPPVLLKSPFEFYWLTCFSPVSVPLAHIPEEVNPAVHAAALSASVPVLIKALSA